MILVDGHPIPSSSSTGSELLASLIANPTLIAASERLKALPERKLSASAPAASQSPPAPATAQAQARHVYVFQREYATVDPSLVELVGMDEATTCVGLVIRNRNSGMTSVSHMDFPGVVDKGLTQMFQLLGDDDAPLDVHLIGAFEDASTNHIVHSAGPRRQSRQEGYSIPLCRKIVEALQKNRKEFHLQTLCVLEHNTTTDSYGNARPIIGGFLVDTSSGLIAPASFDASSRCPDEIVRRIRVTVSSYDPSCQGKLLETYDSRHDKFHIAPVRWTSNWAEIAFTQLQLSDTEVLLQCSTSPAAEPPHFVANERRIWSYLIEYPDWRQTFPGRKPRIFERTSDGGWSRCE